MKPILSFLCALVSFAAAIEHVRLAPDGNGFQLHPSAARYVPWGHNYSSVDVLERMEKDPARIQREFAEMKAAGTTVVRIHPEMPRLMSGPETMNPTALDHLKALLQVAEKVGIHVQITGLACYKIKDRMAWYDALNEQERWKTQAFFWASIARTCAASPAVFAYDLVNEPSAAGTRAEGYYMGKMGDVEFCQRLTLEPGTRSHDDIMSEWTKRMVAAIREHDRQHSPPWACCPFPEPIKSRRASRLRFAASLSENGQGRGRACAVREIRLGQAHRHRRDIPAELRRGRSAAILLRSRGTAHGWMGHWPDESPTVLADMKKPERPPFTAPSGSPGWNCSGKSDQRWARSQRNRTSK